jgi:glycosyltransferase involved in cell wall biosynthesis
LDTAATKLRITWASTLILDLSLHRTTQIELLKNLATNGNDVFLIGMRSKERLTLKDASPCLIQIPIKFVKVLSELAYMVVLAFFLPFYLLWSKPDIVIMDLGLSIFGSIPGLMVSKFIKTKFILDIRSTPVDLKGILGALHVIQFDLSVFFAKRFFSGISIITPMMRDEICKRYSIKPEKFGIWTSGVSESLFDPIRWKASGEQLRREFGLSKSFILFYHGSLTIEREIPQLIEASKHFIQQGNDFVLFLLGSGPAVPLLTQMVKKESIERNVIIHDAVKYEEVPKFISMSNVCIIPLPNNSLWRYQSPLKLLEYFSMQKVVIATDMPAHRRVAGNAECCLYLQSTNIESIIKSIEFSMLNKGKMKAWGASGRAIILREYTWSKVASDFEKYLIQIYSD